MEINAELIKKTSDEDMIDYLLELDGRSDQTKDLQRRCQPGF